VAAAADSESDAGPAAGGRSRAGGRVNESVSALAARVRPVTVAAAAAAGRRRPPRAASHASTARRVSRVRRAPRPQRQQRTATPAFAARRVSRVLPRVRHGVVERQPHPARPLPRPSPGPGPVTVGPSDGKACGLPPVSGCHCPAGGCLAGQPDRHCAESFAERPRACQAESAPSRPAGPGVAPASN
jgi:hypothetical protein